MIHICLLAAVAYVWTGELAGEDVPTKRPNVLLLLVDDLKPALGCYGDPVAITPNIDRLAKRSTRFDLAYCNQAVCAPSRFTLMLGSHSTSTGLYGLGSHLRKIIPDAVTLPQHFSKQGYRTESLGKIFHIGHGNLGDPDSFSVPHFHDKVIEYLDPSSTDGGKLTREEAYFTNQKLGQIRSLPRGAAFENPEVQDSAYADGRVAAETINRLQAAKARLEKTDTPFLIAAGFVRPHLPFSAPKKYWERFDPEKLPMPLYEKPPVDASAYGLKRGGEISNYKPVPLNGIVEDRLKRELIHGYYASTSFVDAQIGKVLDELTRLELDQSTIVVLWGDHGFHLGDHQFWTKHTNYEQANRIPMLIAAPGVSLAGSSTNQPAESVDLFPTLAELCGLPAAKGPQPIDGISLVPVLKDPQARVRDHAYHAYPRRKLGRAIRTERYRLVEWRGMDEAVEKAEYELYDYQSDPLEKKNVAKTKPLIVQQLTRILRSYPDPVNHKSRNLKNQRSEKNKQPSPQIAQVPISISATVEAKSPSGVVIAQGGREHGYAIHFHDGKLYFDVRVNGVVARLESKKKYPGRTEIRGELNAETIRLIINGREIAKKRSPGLIPVQPKDDLSIGEDIQTAAGNYIPPNRFNGDILSTRVTTLGAK
jgi:iduronate 2-sulfatase